jgi:hypothetical protein
MNAVPRSVLPQQHLSRRPAANSREMRSRVAFSPTVTSMPSRTAGQKIERLNTDARLRKPNPWDPTTSRLDKGAATLTGNSGTLPVSVAQSSMRKGQRLSTAGRSERTAMLPLSPRPEPIWLSSLLFLQLRVWLLQPQPTQYFCHQHPSAHPILHPLRRLTHNLRQGLHWDTKVLEL